MGPRRRSRLLPRVFTRGVKGGDPSAGSPTDTLLRLSPPRGPQNRRTPKESPSTRARSAGLTGSVCKEQGRIHRAIVTRDYWGFHLHEGEFQPSIRTETGFRGLASPFGVASHCPGHCMARVARGIRGILTYRRPLLPPAYAGSPRRVPGRSPFPSQLRARVSLVA